MVRSAKVTVGQPQSRHMYWEQRHDFWLTYFECVALWNELLLEWLGENGFMWLGLRCFVTFGDSFNSVSVLEIVKILRFFFL